MIRKYLLGTNYTIEYIDKKVKINVPILNNCNMCFSWSMDAITVNAMYGGNEVGKSLVSL